MERPPERMNMWVPAAGDIVRLKSGFDQTQVGFGYGQAERQANIRMPREGRLYEVQEYKQDSETRGLRMREVRVIHVAGKRIVTPVEHGDMPEPHSIEFFELAREHQEKRN